MSHPNATMLNAKDLLNALDNLGQRLAQHGELAEIALYGGAALVLGFDLRPSTRDVDYVPIEADPYYLKGLVRETASEQDLSEDWLNDCVSDFASIAPEHEFLGDFPRQGAPGLRVFIATPEYLFAMKCMAMRDCLATSDFRDVWDLADLCGITTLETACDVVERFYPARLPRRHRLLLDDIFDAKRQGQAYSAALGW